MGLFKRSYSSSTSYITDSKNPNPNEFNVICELKINNFFISEVHYPNCTNYEGRKILLTKNSVTNKQYLDPHFTDESDLIARFVPNVYGWEAAKKLANGL